MPIRVQHLLLEHFVAGMTARAAARSVRVQGRTAVVFFQRLRQLVASQQASFLFTSEIEIDERNLVRKRQGRREQRASEAVPVFGLLVRDDKIYTAIVPDAETKTVIPIIIRENLTPDAIIYTNSSQTCDKLNVSEFQYKCIKPGKTVLSRHGYHINRVENFWNDSRRYLRRFNGIPKTSLYWYLKECEWRFNGSDHHALSEQLTNWYQSEIHKS